MVKNYAVLLLIAIFLFPKDVSSQEIQIFSIEDFDLKGNVKSCFVSTKYGKEEYDFNENGLLAKSVTRYSHMDYDITYYKYDSRFLVEKRLENYRDNVLDASTSIANFYTIDSLLNLKITEKIVSYSKEFLDQYEYYFKNDSIFKMIHSNDSGIDETLISYRDIKGEQTKIYELNGVRQKSIRTSLKMKNDSVILRNVLTKKFLEGKPSSAVEELFGDNNELLSHIKFFNNETSKRFGIAEKVSYFYNEKGMLLKSESVNNGVSQAKEYIYQFDANGNWIKEIITPANTYKTRKISYYGLAEEVKEE